MPGLHKTLFDRALAALRGDPVPVIPNLEDGMRGSVNYRGMEAVVAIAARGNSAPWVRWLETQERDGHGAIRGPEGVAVETFAGDPHRRYNTTPVVGVWWWAIQNKFPHIAAACARWVGREVAGYRKFNLKGRVELPRPRVKLEKKQTGYDRLADQFLAICEGRKAGAESEDLDYLRKIFAGPEGEKRRLAVLDTPFPNLAIKIKFQHLANGGYAAWYEDTHENRRALTLGNVEGPERTSSQDWVVVRPGQPTLRGYDFDTPPPLDQMHDAIGDLETLG